LETAAVLARRDARYRFVMFGRGGDFSVPDIENLAHNQGISHRVETAGFRQPAENNLAALDLLLAPAPQEPFGRTLVEAIMLRTPIVATRGAGHTEIIDAWGGGVLASEHNSAVRVADLCTMVLATPDRYHIAAARIGEISDELSAAASARRILAVYGQVIGSTKPRGWSLRSQIQG
jgi:glycosyltransferase involved in cell wall biosynthesis